MRRLPVDGLLILIWWIISRNSSASIFFLPHLNVLFKSINMNRYIWCLVFVCYAFSGWGQSPQDEKIVADAAEQLRYLVEYTEQLVQDSTRVSPRTMEKGELQ